MGNKQQLAYTNRGKEGTTREENKITRTSFDFQYVIGRGGFGKVWKVNQKKFKKLYALKEMSKAKIVDKKSEKSVRYERELLARIKHPFIVNMHYAFQDFENLYIVLDLLTGGDLRYHVSRHRRFTEEQTKFFMACILLSLEYIHKNNILHRDIKPENLVLDDKGFVGLTDFGIAKIYQKENSSETSGTPGYMAPEVMCAQNHTIAVDYFALGVIGYEFMIGKRPYLGRSRKEIKEMIMSKQVQVKKNDVPEGWSYEAADLVNKLLQRKPINRLGLRGAAEVKEHIWFKDFAWQDLLEKKMSSPFLPKPADNFDNKYCNAPEKIGEETKERYERYLAEESTQLAFKDFYYVNDNEITPTPVPKPAVKPVKDEKSTPSLPREYKGSISSSTSNLISKNPLKGNIPSSLSSSSSSQKIGTSSSSASSNIGTSDVSKYKVESKVIAEKEKTPSLLDSRLGKPRKSGNSMSTSSLLKQYKQMSSISGSSLKSILGQNNISQHKRTGSTKSNNNFGF